MRYSAPVAACIAPVLSLMLSSVRVQAQGSPPRDAATLPASPIEAPPTAPRVPRSSTRAMHRRSPGPATAILPGFETRADGSTRLFVELSQEVDYQTSAGPGTITYILKGTHVDRRNDSNPLVTEDFNTPVTSARLTSHGHDVWFVIALRAAVLPIVTVDAEKEGRTRMQIEFAKGDYVPTVAIADTSATGASAGSPVAERQSPSDKIGSGH